MSVLLDSGVFYAFLSRRDVHHPEARRIFERIRSGALGAARTTTFVLDETLTLLQRRGHGWDVAEDLLSLVGFGTAEQEPMAMVEDVTSDDLPAALRLQHKHWDRGLSFTDCTLLRVMDREGIDRLATFDGGFEGLVPLENGR